MEKKIKKLSLKKETIVVLDGEKMRGIIGGGGELNPCGPNAIFANGKCYCMENYQGDPYIECRPKETIIVTSVYCTSNVGCNSCNATCGGCQA